MPVSGKPTPFHETLLNPRHNAAVWQAAAELAHFLPKPHSFTSSVGFGFRMRRLRTELAEFDFLHRLRRGAPASPKQLYLVGEAIISQRKGGFPANGPRLDEPLFVNPTSFEHLAQQSGDGPRTSKRRNSQ